MTINEGKPCHRSNYSSRSGAVIQYIVIHYTAGNGDTAAGNCNYFASGSKGASAHYFVGEDGIYQSVPDNMRAWHCGGTTIYKHRYCRNANSIGIEMCSKKSGGEYYIADTVAAQAIELTKYLMKKYGIPAENVIRHYDVWEKQCPAPFVTHPEQWISFKKQLTESEGLTVTQYEELKAEISELKTKTGFYNYIDGNMPQSYKPTIQKLVSAGKLEGNENGELMLTTDMMRILTILDRFGVFG